MTAILMEQENVKVVLSKSVFSVDSVYCCYTFYMKINWELPCVVMVVLFLQVDCIETALERSLQACGSSSLRVSILLDFTRGSRGKHVCLVIIFAYFVNLYKLGICAQKNHSSSN